jgi:cytochrome c oxidase subunit 2
MVAVSGFFSVLIATLILFFAIRYREGGPAAEKLRTAPRSERSHGHGRGAIMLEIVWTVIPFVLAMGNVRMGHEALLHALSTSSRRHADLCGRQATGMWKFQHPEGVREINELHVPIGQNVRLSMQSEDVIHSFFVPAFPREAGRVPGRFTQTWFRATRTESIICSAPSTVARSTRG